MLIVPGSIRNYSQLTVSAYEESTGIDLNLA